MTWAQARTNIYTIATQVLPGVPIIWANDAGARPTTAYVTLNLLAKIHHGLGYESSVATKDSQGNPITAVQGVFWDETLAVGLQGYMTGADDYLETLVETTHVPWWVDVYESYGFAPLDHEPIRDISQIVDSLPELRFVSQIDLGAGGYMLNTNNGAGAYWIEFVDWSGSIYWDAAQQALVEGMSGVAGQ